MPVPFSNLKKCFMPEYSINKGVGKGAEFKGLKAQYLIMFGIGLLGSFMLFFIIYVFLGLNMLFAIVIVVALTTGFLWYIFKMNKKYGEHGLMKSAALMKEPSHLINLGTLTNRMKSKAIERGQVRLLKKYKKF